MATPTPYNPKRLAPLALAALMGMGLGACAADYQEARHTDLSTQLAEMNRRLTDAQVRIEDLSNRVAAWEARASAAQGAPTEVRQDLKLVKLVPAEKENASTGLTLSGGYATNGVTRAGETDQAAREKDWRAAKETWQAKSCPEGGAAFARFLASHGEGTGSALAHYAVGSCDLAAQRYLAALTQLQKATSVVGFEREADAFLQMARAYLALGDRARAEDVFGKIVERFPGSVEAEQAARERKAAAPDAGPNP